MSLFVEVKIPTEWLEQRATIRESDKMDRRGTPRKEVYRLSTLVVAEALGVDVVDGDGYDIIWNGKRVTVKGQSQAREAKSVVRVGRIPKAEVDDKSDIYVFVRVHEDLTVAWILGWIPHDEFYYVAEYLKQGTPIGCTRVPESGYHIHALNLAPISLGTYEPRSTKIRSVLV